MYWYLLNTVQWLFDFKQFDWFGGHRLSAHIQVIDYICIGGRIWWIRQTSCQREADGGHGWKTELGIIWYRDKEGRNDISLQWGISRFGWKFPQVSTKAALSLPQHSASNRLNVCLLQNCCAFLNTRHLRCCLPKTSTVAVSIFLCHERYSCTNIHVQITKLILVCENNLKSESTQRFKFWLSRYPGRPGSRGDFGPTLKSRYW